ncbi:MAG: hypothetical protein HYX48_06175 [Chlamydiales bacterium]|nr:hypothetical protein [Chlamydiales bacterium]
MNTTSTITTRCCYTFFLLLGLLFATACAKEDNWALNSVRSGSAPFSSTKLSYPAKDKINGIGFELLSTSEKIRIYLNVHSEAVPAYEGDTQKALVRIATKNRKQVILAHRRSGGQRLLLPESIYPFILATLENGHSITFQIPGYIATIEPEGFSKNFEKMQHPSRLQELSTRFESFDF